LAEEVADKEKREKNDEEGATPGARPLIVR
jgi:hypothetical protein